ncbi:MAG: phage Gp37/Gp68 family protein [Planctomycetia bacterium]|nr:phage Gp37/Gp68 family protein [Planctomycetia bacterium]
MSIGTGIEWTDATFNPWTGCTKVSPGCKFCYAALFDSRHLHEKQSHWGPGARRMPASEAQWEQVAALNRRAEKRGTPLRVFCASMADVFESEAPVAQQKRLWETIAATPHLRWQLLTKRPERVLETIPEAWRVTPPPNVWYGTSVESADYLRRVAELQKVPAAVRFLSVEPLLGSIPLMPLDGIGWVILGGESGPHARPMEAEWAREIRDQVVRVGVPLFFKQWGQHNSKGRRMKSKKFKGYNRLDGKTWRQFPKEAS